MTTGGHTADVRGAEASRALPTAVPAVRAAGAATAAVLTAAALHEAVPTAAVPPEAEAHTVEEVRMAAVAAAVEVAGEAGR